MKDTSKDPRVWGPESSQMRPEVEGRTYSPGKGMGPDCISEESLQQHREKLNAGLKTSVPQRISLGHLCKEAKELYFVLGAEASRSRKVPKMG